MKNLVNYCRDVLQDISLFILFFIAGGVFVEVLSTVVSALITK